MVLVSWVEKLSKINKSIFCFIFMKKIISELIAGEISFIESDKVERLSDEFDRD